MAGPGQGTWWVEIERNEPGRRPERPYDTRSPKGNRRGEHPCDAIYLALALSTGSMLATLDRRLAEGAGAAGLLIGSPGTGRVSEPQAVHPVENETNAGWAHSAIVGAHIAELRRDALGAA